MGTEVTGGPAVPARGGGGASGVAGPSVELQPDPLVGECVLCFTARVVGEHGCDGTLRWIGRFRELAAPAATGVEARLARRGEPCDGRVVLDGWRLTREACVRDVHTDELSVPDPMPWCLGVRPGSSRPCGLWELSRPGARGVVVGRHGNGCRWPPRRAA
ncbi:DUF2695 domain-containing protein [Nocardioides perillae]|uniref:Uncharacterized protein n=1 Tax=Nocardioides perillae TaxID=1119534 RepID=A0A7Y9USJ6_9ACTN|nr:hypothetical protein [Nocardioides perillae]